MGSHITAKISGTGSYLPETSIDNFELYTRDEFRGFDIERARASIRKTEEVDALSDEDVFDKWARQVTGIRARRVLDPASGLTTEDMCAQASLRALDAAGLENGGK